MHRVMLGAICWSRPYRVDVLANDGEVWVELLQAGIEARRVFPTVRGVDAKDSVHKGRVGSTAKGAVIGSTG